MPFSTLNVTQVQAQERYKECREIFAQKVLRAQHASHGAGGIKAKTAQHYWASVLFTRIAVTAGSIKILTPSLEPNAHCDFSAVASITRNLAECYLFFYFLCVDDVSQDEKDGRIIILNLHDHSSRGRLMSELDGVGEPENTTVHDDLVQRFSANPYLSGLPEKRKKELIRGDKIPFIQDDVIARIGMNRSSFRFLYRFFSNHTHTGPISFYRMAEQGRGIGFHNKLDDIYIAYALDFAGDILNNATE